MSKCTQAVKCSVQVRPESQTPPISSCIFSPITTRLCWAAFVVLHAYCWVYFAAMACFYWGLPGTTLDVWLYFYELSLGSDYDRVIAVVLGSVAAIHFVYLLWIVGWSLRKRAMIFAVYDVFGSPGLWSPLSEASMKRYACRVYRAVLIGTGLIGVDGPYFDLLLLCREIVETALQTQQAYRLSLLLPRTQLNRCYVALLVLNCWATALIHSAFHKSSVKRRFYVIVSDCVLDLVTSVGISTVLLAIYSKDFDGETNQFPVYKWYEDVWLVHILSEFQIVLVTSWGDLAMRVVFALSMIGNMDNMKKLLSTTTEPQASTGKKRLPSANRRISSVQPSQLQPQVADVKSAYTQRRLRNLLAVESRASRLLFFLWGIFLIIVHLYAESISGLPQCAMQVKPWFVSKPSCSLLILDCHKSNFTGESSEVITEWQEFDPSTPAGVVIKHCPSLEVPEMITKFTRLRVLKFYNSTIATWGASAAISQTHHPNLIMLFLVRVNMTNGELPPGLQSDDFPQALMDIEFCVTNLRTLPDDFDLKWPKFATIYFEACNMTEVPDSLSRLAPFALSLALNPIRSIPPAVLEGNVGYLHVGGTLISELPKDAVNVSPFLKIRVDNTNVSFFWDWVDPMVLNTGAVYNNLPTILATNSPYCVDLERIYSGEQTGFSVPKHVHQSIVLSDASTENWATLRKAVFCDPGTETLYLIEHEDLYNRIEEI